MNDLPFNTDIAISFQDEAWQDLIPGLEKKAEEIILLALEAISRELALQPVGIKRKPTVEISLLFTSDEGIRGLNRDYRNKDQPTNVLSFPDSPLEPGELERAFALAEPLMLGDVVMARETLIREAAAQHKCIGDHLTHLLIHGVLHLAGFDHMEENEAEDMENLEIMILRNLHIANPYELSDQPRQETPDRK